jgi:hypothetical protein
MAASPLMGAARGALAVAGLASRPDVLHANARPNMPTSAAELAFFFADVLRACARPNMPEGSLGRGSLATE